MDVKIGNSPLGSNSVSGSDNIRSNSSNNINSSSGATSFKEVMKTARLDDFNGTMQELLEVVRSRGEQFVNTPEENALNSYRESVKYFLRRLREEFLSLKEEFGAESGGEQKIYQLVDTAGDQADALTQEAFTHDRALEMLSSLDDIRGMVIDVIG